MLCADAQERSTQDPTPKHAATRPPRVLFVAPFAYGLNPGGMQRQVEATAFHLEKLDLAAVVRANSWQCSFDDIDICHIFTTSPEVLPYAIAARQRGVPIFVSPIYYPSGALSTAALKARVLVRLPGCYSNLLAARSLLQLASRVLPLTSKEARALQVVFGTPRARMTEIPNGVDPRFANAAEGPFVAAFGHRPDILFVGRLDRNKNVLGLVRAIEATDLSLTIIGFGARDEPEVEAEVRSRTNQRIRYIGSIPWESPLLPSAYAAAKVLCLPSFKEVMPLTILEALAAGCRIVTTRNSAMTDLLGDAVHYCDPGNVQSIRTTVIGAIHSEEPRRLREEVLTSHTWPSVVMSLSNLYRNELVRAESIPTSSHPVDMSPSTCGVIRG
ncbi:MAG: glycosyltransferase family 4 protein [Acidobacteria bacterium]|nr:glycosyltransferase family 4 protein [Acidobacteriota bacterium]